MSDFIETHLPCPCGESSDAFSLDKEGNGFCFSCNKPYNKSEINKSNLVSEKPKQETQPHKYLKDVDLDFGYIAQRGIPSEIMEMYNVRTAIYENTAIQVRFPYPSGAETKDIPKGWPKQIRNNPRCAKRPNNFPSRKTAKAQSGRFSY